MTGDRRDFGFRSTPGGRVPFTYHVVASLRPGRGSAANSKCAQTSGLVDGIRSSGGPSTVELAHASETTPSGGDARRSLSVCGVSAVGLPTAVISSVKSPGVRSRGRASLFVNAPFGTVSPSARTRCFLRRSASCIFERPGTRPVTRSDPENTLSFQRTPTKSATSTGSGGARRSPATASPVSCPRMRRS